MFELHQMIGVYRFRIDSQDDRLVPWPKIRRAAGISDAMTSALVRIGRAVGADPKQWRGALVPVPLEAVTFEAWNSTRGWMPSSVNTEAEAWAIHAASIRHAAASEVLAIRKKELGLSAATPDTPQLARLSDRRLPPATSGAS